MSLPQTELRTSARLTTALREARRKHLKPPPKLTVSQWADAYRRLSPEASSEPGRWLTERAEYQRGIMDAVSDPAVEMVVVMSSAQVGKTEIINNVVGFHIHQDPAPLLLLQPTLEMAMAWSKDRLAPMLRDTPALKDKVKDPRARDSGNTLLHKSFAGGHITMAGANSPASLASRPIRVVLCDEVDRYPASAGSEGDPVNLARKRATTFWNRKTILVSTPTVKGASRIETAWNESDQRRFYVPCPHCGHAQHLKWSNVHWDEGRPETAQYACEACGVLWTDAERWTAVRAGVWKATAPFKGIAGFHLSELYSSWVRLGDTARAFLDAKRGGTETLKTWINTALGETWEDRGEQTDAATLAQRREPYDRDTLPQPVLALTAGVDVQDNRLEVEVIGWGVGEESWGIEYIVLTGDPAKPDLWERLDQVLAESYRTEDGRALRIRAACVDSGGHHTHMAYQFCAARSGRHVYAVKGRNGPQPIWPKRASKSKKYTGFVLRVIGVDTAKDTIYGRYRITETGPGYCHFPSTYDEEWFRQATAEKRVTKTDKRGGKVREWHAPKGVRNEASDCRVYGYTALVAESSERRINLAALALSAERYREQYELAHGEPPTAAAEPVAPPSVRAARPTRFRIQGR